MLASVWDHRDWCSWLVGHIVTQQGESHLSVSCKTRCTGPEITVLVFTQQG